MGDPGEPGSPSKEIIRASLLAGCGIAVCTCKVPEGTNPMAHAPDCEIRTTHEEAVRILEK